MINVLVVCPSVTEAHAARFCAAVSAAMAKGADLRAVLVANHASVQALAAEWPDVVVPGTNAGFAVSINQGAAAGGEFRWLVVANDDMDYEADTFVRMAEFLAGETAEEHRLIRLARELPWRRIPGPAGVFANLSMIEQIAFGLGGLPDTATQSPDDPRLYAPLSLVAISAPLWEAVAGLEESLPFCYEDAWFGRVAQASGVRLDSHDLDVHHLIAASTRSRVDVVLPVITWSAFVYLELLGVRPFLARALCLAALLVRTPLSLIGSAHRGKHLRGIRDSARALLTGRKPSLPAPGSPALTG
ncbi:hypothetical protein [Geodermatophilus sp. URMC 64]